MTLDLSFFDTECPRCGRTAPMRFRGPCRGCRDELYEKFPGSAREVAAPEYEPKVNVTPNAVALRES